MKTVAVLKVTPPVLDSTTRPDQILNQRNTRREGDAMQKLEDAIERLKRIQEREAAKAEAKAEGRAVATVTPIKRRMIESSVEIMGQPVPDDFLYQHTLFCQTVLPYRDPGSEVRTWERAQGNTRLYLEAGKIYDQFTDEIKPIGLPFGPAARLILCHLNTEALRRGEPRIEIEGSMTAFVHRLQGFAPNGHEIRRFKDQVARLSAALIRMVLVREESALQVDTKIIGSFELWKDKSEGGQLTFPSVIDLSPQYFESLQNHAVPLDERAVSALAHSAMALDVYCWMAQRLHRVDPRRGQFLAWANLHEQFGQSYKHIRMFRHDFLNVLKLVKAQYPAARFGTDEGGMMLGNSPPPVQRRAVLVGSPSPTPAPALPIPNAQRLTLPKPPRA
jgi:hypothetical protein